MGPDPSEGATDVVCHGFIVCLSCGYAGDSRVGRRSTGTTMKGSGRSGDVGTPTPRCKPYEHGAVLPASRRCNEESEICGNEECIAREIQRRKETAVGAQGGQSWRLHRDMMHLFRPFLASCFSFFEPFATRIKVCEKQLSGKFRRSTRRGYLYLTRAELRDEIKLARHAMARP